jgi:DNA polymerase III psi subunit
VRDEMSFDVLAEMGIDVYVLRSTSTVEAVPAASAPNVERAKESSSPTRDARAKFATRVVLFTRDDDARSHALLAQIARALVPARIEGAIVSTIDEATLGDAAGLVVFGKASTRQAGASVSGERMKRLQWVAATELSEIAANARAKRALWSELKRVMRALRG